MKNDKSPGSDGFTAECYNFVWKDICHLDTKKTMETKITFKCTLYIITAFIVNRLKQVL